jgi:hypothetical protein
MKEYTRDYPLFSLCGLNCGLCPRFHTDGSSKCPGCGGYNFHLKHPACAVINCNKKHDNVEFCFQCSSYSCDKYTKNNDKDSFISYMNVGKDIQSASQDINTYKNSLEEKIQILEFLLAKYNDGRRKNVYCLAVNLLSISDLREIKNKIVIGIGPKEISLKEKIQLIIGVIYRKAEECGVKLVLRK